MDALVEVLDLEPIEVNIFRGVSPQEHRQRIFGGQVAGQALVAAARTVAPDRRVHSLHAYFLRAGDPKVPVLYEVERLRDGGSFTTRRVAAIQHGKVIFNLSASFQVAEEGFDHAFAMPEVPPPDDLPTMRERLTVAGVDVAAAIVGERWRVGTATLRVTPFRSLTSAEIAEVEADKQNHESQPTVIRNRLHKIHRAPP